jgi:hypothetical protein
MLQTQNWRGFHCLLSGLFDFVPLPLPFLLNSIDLVLYERLDELLFKLKQAPSLVHSLVAPIEMDQ